MALGVNRIIDLPGIDAAGQPSQYESPNHEGILTRTPKVA